MAEYHVGCGAFAIYAGTLEPENESLLTDVFYHWRNKSECTDEAVCAVAQYLLQEDKSVTFNYKDKKYRLCVLENELAERLKKFISEEGPAQ